MFFSVITKSSNWEILTKNLLTFKGSDRVKNEKLWRSLKNPIFTGGELWKNQYREGNCLKKGAWIDCRFKVGGGGLARKRGFVFLRGVDTPMHTMINITKEVIPYLL